MNLFNPLLPVLESRGRDGATRTDLAWRKPVVVAVNRGTRSSKEMVAHLIQQKHVGRVVGQRTAGDVLTGRPFILKDGSLLMVAIQDGAIDGAKLEGRGVIPDVTVEDRVPFAEGRDVLLDKALELAATSR